MCLILDANEAARFVDEASTTFKAVYKWMSLSDGRLAIGGLNERELRQVGSVVKLLKSWSARGKLRHFSESAVEAVEKKQVAGMVLKSNDSHIIALAIVSGARIICSKDKALVDDFAQLAPAGKVYRGPKDSGVLKHHKACAPKPRK